MIKRVGCFTVVDLTPLSPLRPERGNVKRNALVKALSPLCAGRLLEVPEEGEATGWMPG